MFNDRFVSANRSLHLFRLHYHKIMEAEAPRHPHEGVAEILRIPPCHGSGSVTRVYHLNGSFLCIDLTACKNKFVDKSGEKVDPHCNSSPSYETNLEMQWRTF